MVVSGRPSNGAIQFIYERHEQPGRRPDPRRWRQAGLKGVDELSAIAVHASEGKAVKLGPNDVGVIFRVYSENTGGQFALVEHPIEPGALAVPHVQHNEDEFSYVLEGEVALQLGDTVTTERRGALVAKPRNIWHAMWNETSSPARILEIISPGTGFERYFEEMAALFPKGGPPDLEAAMKVSLKYKIEADPSCIPDLVAKYHLKPWPM
jgi:quercetin dioxygenase-like cupin family protein